MKDDPSLPYSRDLLGALHASDSIVTSLSVDIDEFRPETDNLASSKVIATYANTQLKREVTMQLDVRLSVVDEVPSEEVQRANPEVFFFVRQKKPAS